LLATYPEGFLLKKEKVMSYKTILVHVDSSRHAAQRVMSAIQLAKVHNAHLIGAAVTGVSRFVLQAGAALPADPNLALHLEQLRQSAHRAADQAATLAQQEGQPTFEKRILDDDASGGLAELARYSDLAVVSQFDPDEPGVIVPPDFPEYVVFNSGKPTLLLPHTGSFTSIGRRVLIAWDGSRTATRAVADALPLLRQASRVHVAIYNQAAAAIEQVPAGIELIKYLTCHGVNVELLPTVASSDVGNSLLSQANDFGSDLIVMGGYGHSRFREILLGGVTRTVLDSMTIPVLMSH
jgi:nucleotide-binding universal stress UspA family protein